MQVIMVLPSLKLERRSNKMPCLLDEMGLGKTITMLALVLANPCDISRPPAMKKSVFFTKATLVRQAETIHCMELSSLLTSLSVGSGPQPSMQAME